jgi:hypothetical protein
VPEKFLSAFNLAATYDFVLFGSQSTHSVKLPCPLDSDLQEAKAGQTYNGGKANDLSAFQSKVSIQAIGIASIKVGLPPHCGFWTSGFFAKTAVWPKTGEKPLHTIVCNFTVFGIAAFFGVFRRFFLSQNFEPKTCPWAVSRSDFRVFRTSQPMRDQKQEPADPRMSKVPGHLTEVPYRSPRFAPVEGKNSQKPERV